MGNTKIKIKTWQCEICGYLQDFKPTLEAMRINFPEVPGILGKQCPSCKSIGTLKKLKKDKKDKMSEMEIRDAPEQVLEPVLDENGDIVEELVDKPCKTAQEIQDIKDEFEYDEGQDDEKD